MEARLDRHVPAAPVKDVDPSQAAHGICCPFHGARHIISNTAMGSRPNCDHLGRQILESQTPPASIPQAPETAESDIRLPLLRQSEWEEYRQYNKSDPVCIHYNFQWRVCRHENKRTKLVCQDSVSSIVIAPSDFWKLRLQEQLQLLLQNKEHSRGGTHACTATKIKVSVAGTRGCGLKKDLPHQNIDWNDVDTHIEGLEGLFRRGKKITLSTEFIYSKIADSSTTARTSAKDKRKKSRSDEQRARLDREAGLWTRVYKQYRCRKKNCRRGPHCMKDPQGNHHGLDHKHLQAIYRSIKDGAAEENNPGDARIDSDIPATVMEEIFGGGDDSADPAQRLQDYCTWVLAQVQSDRYRKELEVAVKFAIDECLELASIAKHPQAIVSAMVRSRVKLGTALKFVGGVEKFKRETNSAA